MSLEGIMAEGEGFEPPIPVKVCLISSQVHSTGLCHLSETNYRMLLWMVEATKWGSFDLPVWASIPAQLARSVVVHGSLFSAPERLKRRQNPPLRFESPDDRS